MSLVTVAELSWLCLHLQTTHPASGGSSQEAEILEAGKGCSVQAEEQGFFLSVLFWSQI